MIIGRDERHRIFLPACTEIKRKNSHGSSGPRALDFYCIVEAMRHRSHGRWSDWSFEDAIDGTCRVDPHQPGIAIVAPLPPSGRAPLQAVVHKDRLTPARDHQWRLLLACGHTQERGEPLPKKMRCEACLLSHLREKR